MSYQVESIPLQGLRKSHLRQLSAYIHERDEDGWYYGPKPQFDSRHEDLKGLAEWLDAVANDPDARLPRGVPVWQENE